MRIRETTEEQRQLRKKEIRSAVSATWEFDWEAFAMRPALFSFLFLRVNYALYAICITSYVVFQLASVGLPTAELIPARIVYTVLGGLLALLLQIFWPAAAVVVPQPPAQEEARRA